jgi:hypothetical protein
MFSTKGVLENALKELETAKKLLEEAKKVVQVSKAGGGDVSKQEAEINLYQYRYDTTKASIEKMLKAL